MHRTISTLLFSCFDLKTSKNSRRYLPSSLAAVICVLDFQTTKFFSIIYKNTGKHSEDVEFVPEKWLFFQHDDFNSDLCNDFVSVNVKTGTKTKL